VIVGPVFEGDEWEALWGQQHDAYGQGLSIIVNEGRRRLDEAEALVGPTPLGDEIRRDDFDHHVLQHVHDMLAAEWRLRHDLGAPPLPLPGFHVEALATQWLEWLRHRVQGMSQSKMRDVLMLGFMDPDPYHSAELRLLPAVYDDLAAVARERGVRLLDARPADTPSESA